jgi:hypothetical protein
VLRSSVSGLALPSSVTGRDGTRLICKSGIALRTNSRVARKCPPFPVRCQYNAPDRPRVPARAPSRRGPFATCQVSPSRSCPRADRGDPGSTDLLGTHWIRGFIAFRPARRTSTGRDRYCRGRRRAKMSDPRAIFEQTSKTTGHPNEFRFE